MSISAVAILEIGLDKHREIIVRDGKPLEMAYTDDDRITWKLVDIFDKDEYIENPHCFIADRDYCFLATSKGRIYRSIDGARNWDVVENGIFSVRPFELIVRIDKRVYASGNGITICSEDYGDTWDYLENPFDIRAIEFAGG